MDIPRYDVDLGHFNFVSGQLGRLQTLAMIPTIASDTISIDMDLAVRLSALRMPMTLDAKFEVFGFHVKHRNCYDNWENLIKEGFNAASSETLAMHSRPSYTQSIPLQYLPGVATGASLPAHYVQGYNMIWNEYFRIPNVTQPYDLDYVVGEDILEAGYYEADGYTDYSGSTSTQNGIVTCVELNRYLRNLYGDSWITMTGSSPNDSSNSWWYSVVDDSRENEGISDGDIYLVNNILDDISGSTPIPSSWSEFTAAALSNVELEERKYGRRVARLPQQWNTGLPDYAYTNDEFGQVNTSTGSFDLLDVAQARMSLKSEIDRDWFTKRYRDFIGDTFGAGGVSIDADERPELLFHDTFYMSGYDVDNTDSSGRVSGKSAGMFNVKMPSKFLNEHGQIWLMAVMRFPSIVQQEKHYLARTGLDYKTISGDPMIISNHPPVEYEVKDIFQDDSDSTSLGMRAYGDWFRWQPNNVHNDFHDEVIITDASVQEQQAGNGYPFINMEEISFGNQNEISYDAHQNAAGNNAYTDYFQSTRLGHWNVVSRCNVHAKRIVPPASKSINAGV